MTTQTFRVVRVRSAAQSSVARIEGVDENGHELRLEVSAASARGVSEGQILLVQWSLHNQASAPSTEDRSQSMIVDAEFTAPASSHVNPTPAQDPAAVDQEFMSLMNGMRNGKTFTSRDIDHELSTLLGGAGAKGQK